ALAVNAKDAHDATPYFSGAGTVFNDQLGPNQAFLGANVNRSLMQAPAQALEAGVHLHWALPDALTRGSGVDDANGGTLSFPAAPNRWLVHRIVVNNGQATRTSWVVMSDVLNDAMPAGQAAITLPTHRTASGQDFQHSGQSVPFSGQWKEPVIPAGQDFAAMTGHPLSAVSNGQAAFASFYPNCRGVFGFTDTLADLQETGATLMYAVTGWYSKPGDDPLSGGVSLPDAQQRLGWTWDDAGQAEPACSLYHGSVQSIAWHPDATYLPDYSNGLPQVALDLALGNNPPESMASYLQDKLRPSQPYFETMLSAYFEGLAGKLAQPAPSQLASLDEELHENGFKAIKAEYIYTIASTSKDEAGAEVTAGAEAATLPPALGDALNLLNFYAQGVQLLQACIENEQWQLFADWYRIFMAGSKDQQAAYNIAYQKYNSMDTLAQQLASASATLDRQYAAVKAQLPEACTLQKTAAPRYWQGADPVFLIGGPEMPPAGRYGTEGQFNADGYLPCRLPGQLLRSATANKVAVTPSRFAAAALPTPNALPQGALCDALLAESLMLDASLLSALTGATIGFDEVRAAVAGTSAVLALAGTAPSPVALANWNGNPWIPLFAHWEVAFDPVFATIGQDKKLHDYPADFFTGRFTIDQDSGGAIGYTPPSNPASGAFAQRYEGVSILSSSAVNGFARQLGKSADPLLQQCLQLIGKQNMAMQSLSGLNAAMLMQQQELQLNIRVPDSSMYAPLTKAIAKALGGYASQGPDFNGFYNPVRAGYLKFSLTLVDIFGQKKAVQPATVSVAQAMSATWQGQTLPGIAWLPPRLSQASRLLFRFLAADGTGYEEMNIHPATTPVCGWLLPNHLNGSLFVYDAQGASLGSLVLSDDQRRIIWQSAPGNGAFIDQDAVSVMRDQQPQLRDLVVALATGSPQFFADFMSAVDSVNGFVEPQEISSNNDLAVLIGRPVALVQAGVALELKGTPHYNQSMSVLDLDQQTNPLAETENGFTGIDFPVVLGNLQDLNDGLVGYFKAGSAGYDLTRFYTRGAPHGATSGVQAPGQNTVTVKPWPGKSHPLREGAGEKLLMLVDPRAQVHATTGILPTKSIRIPSDMYAATLRALEMTFLTAPVLSGSSALRLPLSNRPGYRWSWVQERMGGGAPRWETLADIDSAPTPGMWTYTPQTVRDGWLRLNPDLLAFGLLDAQGRALLAQGVNDGMTLTLTNRQGRPVTFSPAALVPEGVAASGSVIYLHFGSTTPQAAVQRIRLSAPGWKFACLTDAVYGSYWAASPEQEVVLAGGASLAFQLGQLEIETTKQQAALCADYYGITNINDGVYQELVGVAPAKAAA
ncbi:MAG TPA: hypothetical protein VNT33_03340, partial [Telluria sp.]|nr:hypothetical protein [Telluria sp.]